MKKFIQVERNFGAFLFVPGFVSYLFNWYCCVLHMWLKAAPHHGCSPEAAPPRTTPSPQGERARELGWEEKHAVREGLHAPVMFTCKSRA
jgi:hypothetical protein